MAVRLLSWDPAKARGLVILRLESEYILPMTAKRRAASKLR
jgi:hypothetical protein